MGAQKVCLEKLNGQPNLTIDYQAEIFYFTEAHLSENFPF